MKDVSDERFFRTCAGESNTDAGRDFDDAGSDFDETELERGELGLLERRAVRDGLAHGPEQPVGGGVQDQPHLVGAGAGTRCSIALELGFMKLDQVLGLPSGSVI